MLHQVAAAIGKLNVLDFAIDKVEFVISQKTGGDDGVIGANAK